MSPERFVKGESERTLRDHILTAVHRQDALRKIDIAQVQRDEISAAEAVGRHQAQHGMVAKFHWSFIVEGRDHALHVLPGRSFLHKRMSRNSVGRHTERQSRLTQPRPSA